MAEQPQQQMSEEQVKELQEKIKNMSPEELKEFQKKQCIFCQIISGKVPSKRIYEDEQVLAILDINPASPGHLLIMPKEHYSIMPQVPPEEVSHIFLVAKALSNAALRALEAQGSNILVANGVAAGQKAQHFMVHMIPRKDNDDIDFLVPQNQIPEKDLQKISEILAKSFGTKPAQQTTEKPVVEAEFKDQPAEDHGTQTLSKPVQEPEENVKEKPEEKKEEPKPKKKTKKKRQ